MKAGWLELMAALLVLGTLGAALPANADSETVSGPSQASHGQNKPEMGAPPSAEQRRRAAAKDAAAAKYLPMIWREQAAGKRESSDWMTAQAVGASVYGPQFPQEKYYWCGPSAAKTVLAARGINVSQADAAWGMDTELHGATWGSNMASFLTQKVAGQGGSYLATYVPDPPSGADIATFKARMMSDINTGWALPSALEMTSPRYVLPGYESVDLPIYHWVAVTGYLGSGGSYTHYVDPAANSPAVGWRVPSSATVFTDTFVIIAGHQFYVW